MPRRNPARRAALADAAISLLAAEGIHGLTHRAAEAAAGLPTGTAANYFRSREELLVAAAERAVSLHLEDVQRIDRAVDASSSPDPLAELLAVSLQEAVTASRERHLAIFELQLEARRRPALAAELARLGSVASALTADEHRTLGLSVPPEAIPTLVTLYGGVLFTLVTGPGDVEPDTVRRLAHAVVHGSVDADVPWTPGPPASNGADER
ncbi:AcrR family transcriptional regulator [Geodermatophilus bullaregiensis]|uniref:TetR/AcrR family transcriptional regulator n=1 Tax=Geodermatophilus bullaregiensis TaxID=1564160 RepID=UPI001956670C|nr:TetR/AcrR family transcriptional regulator [Geodermatophilus bullaregiensis]MBM7806859.1 AcrR family transcriptional regulator [Geodermatophilus bullaregiensis]